MSVSEVTMVTILTPKTREKLPYQLLLPHEKQTTKGILPHFHIKNNSRETSLMKMSTNFTRHITFRFITDLSFNELQNRIFFRKLQCKPYDTMHLNPTNTSGSTL